MNTEERIRRLGQRVRALADNGCTDEWNRPFAFPPPLEASALDAVEVEYGVKLPQELRLLLTQVADGGAFNKYEIFSLKLMVGVTEDLYQDLRADEGLERRMAEPFDPLDDRLTASGMLYIEHAGCEFFTGLVVSGPYAGEVWHYSAAEWWPSCDWGGTAPVDAGGAVPWKGDSERLQRAFPRPENRRLRRGLLDYLEHELDRYAGELPEGT